MSSFLSVLSGLLWFLEGIDIQKFTALAVAFLQGHYIWSSVPVAQGDGGVQMPWVMSLFLLRLLFGAGVLVSADISTWTLIKKKKSSSCCQGSSKLLPFHFILPDRFLWCNSVFPVPKAHNRKVLFESEPSSEARVNQIICETALVSPQ